MAIVWLIIPLFFIIINIIFSSLALATLLWLWALALKVTSATRCVWGSRRRCRRRTSSTCSSCSRHCPQSSRCCKGRRGRQRKASYSFLCSLFPAAPRENQPQPCWGAAAALPALGSPEGQGWKRFGVVHVAGKGNRGPSAQLLISSCINLVSQGWVKLEDLLLNLCFLLEMRQKSLKIGDFGFSFLESLQYWFFPVGMMDVSIMIFSFCGVVLMDLMN